MADSHDSHGGEGRPLATRPGANTSLAYSRFLPPIRAKCRRILGSTAIAEDVAQEAFVRLWKSGIGESGDARTVMAWLYRTCTRLAIDALRAQRRDSGAADLEATPCGVAMGAQLEARGAIALLARSVPEDELAAAVLCRVDGMAQPEAASVLGVSERTVRRALERFDERTGALREELTS